MMFIVMELEEFEVEAVNFPLPVKVDKGNMVGYLPVYASTEEALADYPDAELVPCREV